MSAGWLGAGWGDNESSVIARHEWKGLSKMNYNLRDFTARQQAEGAERQRRAVASGNRVMHIPGSYLTGLMDEDDLLY